MKLPKILENLLVRIGGKSVSQENGALPELSKNLKPGQNDLDAMTPLGTTEKLIAEAASPLSQLILQDYIASNQNASITADDVLVNVKRLVAIFESHGMTVIGSPSQSMQYDSQLHESAKDDFRPIKGAPVIVRFPGIAFQSKVLRKAGVVDHEVAQ